MAALPFCRLVLVWVDCVYHFYEFAPSSDGASVNATAAHGAATFFAALIFGTSFPCKKRHHPTRLAPTHKRDLERTAHVTFRSPARLAPPLPLDAFLNLGQDRCRIRQWLVDQPVALIHRMVIVLIEVSNFGTRH
jgi:hypothetical protein